MSLVYIALGSNIGDTEANLRKALAYMQVAGLDVVKQSSFIKTAPYGLLEQADFLNAVCLVQTDFSPQQVLQMLNTIEEKMGRVRAVHWGPRVIDLDILLYDDLVIKENNLQIPHADMLNRTFVLQPLLEITGEDFVHPVSGKKITEHLAALAN